MENGSGAFSLLSILSYWDDNGARTALVLPEEVRFQKEPG